MNEEVKGALFGAQLFYSVFHLFGILLIIAYDNAISRYIVNQEYIYPIYFGCLMIITFYLFFTVGSNPGYAPNNIKEQSERQQQSSSLQEEQKYNEEYKEGEPQYVIEKQVLQSTGDIELKSGPIREQDISLVHTQHSGQEYTSQSGDYENKRVLKPSQNPKPPKFFCQKCNYLQNYRTRHCKKCDVCINKFDHHCFWIGGCVGELNHGKFIIFLYLQSIVMIEAIKIYWTDMIEDEENNKQYYFYMAFFLISLGFFIFSGILALYHSYLICTNQTSWEHQSKDKISYAKYYPRGFYPFDSGLISNLKMVFCHKNQVRDWELPPIEFAEYYIENHFNICDNKYYSCC